MTVIDILILAIIGVFYVVIVGSIIHGAVSEHEYRKWAKKHDDHLRNL